MSGATLLSLSTATYARRWSTNSTGGTPVQTQGEPRPVGDFDAAFAILPGVANFLNWNYACFAREVWITAMYEVLYQPSGGNIDANTLDYPPTKFEHTFDGDSSGAGASGRSVQSFISIDVDFRTTSGAAGGGTENLLNSQSVFLHATPVFSGSGAQDVQHTWTAKIALSDHDKYWWRIRVSASNGTPISWVVFQRSFPEGFGSSTAPSYSSIRSSLDQTRSRFRRK